MYENPKSIREYLYKDAIYYCSEMDSSRVQRLSGVVAIGVATQLASEVITSKSSAHSFWLIVAISLG